jgi:hypothetical protein
MSLLDFMNYLIYIERSAENLQFYLWHQDYVKRFKEAKTPDLALSQEWTKAMGDEVQIKLQREVSEKLCQEAPDVRGIFNGTDFELNRPGIVSPAPDSNAFSAPSQTATTTDSRYSLSTQFSNTSTVRSMASTAFASAGAKIPCE